MNIEKYFVVERICLLKIQNAFCKKWINSIPNTHVRQVFVETLKCTERCTLNPFLNIPNTLIKMKNTFTLRVDTLNRYMELCSQCTLFAAFPRKAQSLAIGSDCVTWRALIHYNVFFCQIWKNNVYLLIFLRKQKWANNKMQPQSSS